MKPTTHDIDLQILAGIYKDLETLTKQIGELTVALRKNGCLSHEQAWAIINPKPEEEK